MATSDRRPDGATLGGTCGKSGRKPPFLRHQHFAAAQSTRSLLMIIPAMGVTDVLAPNALSPGVLNTGGLFEKRGASMPNVANVAPNAAAFTEYNEQQRVLYIRMLDADAEGTDWRDPDREPDRVSKAFDIHLARAKWMPHTGYRLLLRLGAWPSQLSKR